jgi:hypothetical protein
VFQRNPNDAYQCEHSCNHRSDLRSVVACLSLEDTRHALDHTYNTLANDDKGKQLQAFHQMGVLEAKYAPDDSDEEDEKAFDDGDNDPRLTLSVPVNGHI